MFQASRAHENSDVDALKIFKSIVGDAQKIVNQIPDDPPEMLIPFWNEKLIQLECDFSSGIPENFLHNGVITWTMETGWQNYHDKEIAFLKEKLKRDGLSQLICANKLGEPQIVRKESCSTTGNTVHHAYHITRYCDAVGSNLEGVGNIVEWGAGYGGMARLFRRIIPTTTTITLIDVKMFSVLQWLYLSSILGKDAVNLITNKDMTLQGGKINIVPLSLLDVIGWPADLFVSTWAISESAKPCHDWLLSKKVFGAKRFLMSHQGACSAFPFAGELNKLARLAGKDVHELEIEHLPGNYYMFA